MFNCQLCGKEFCYGGYQTGSTQCMNCEAAAANVANLANMINSMDKPFEIILTESQVDFITKLEAGPLKIKSYRITILPDQIVQNKTLSEKWDALCDYHAQGREEKYQGFAEFLKVQCGFDIDAAYLAVVGEE